VRRLSTCAHPSSLPGVCLAGGWRRSESHRVRVIASPRKFRTRAELLITFADRGISGGACCFLALTSPCCDNAGSLPARHLSQLTRSRGSPFTSSEAGVARSRHVKSPCDLMTRIAPAILALSKSACKQTRSSMDVCSRDEGKAQREYIERFGCCLLTAREYPIEIPLSSLIKKRSNGGIPSLARPAYPRASKSN